MKNQMHQTRLWQRFMVTAFFVMCGTTYAFADASNCLNPMEVILSEKVIMKFCDIPAAQGVLIGSENGSSDEMPVKARDFQSFQMAQFEVTQLQYTSVMNQYFNVTDHPYEVKIVPEPWKENGKLKTYDMGSHVQEHANNPAVCISHNDARRFLFILNLIDKTATYRLPTEAEFEYAARAGTTTNYYWGTEMDANFAYSWGNTQYARQVDSCPNMDMNQKSPGYCANGFGLYHMLGNAREWTADAYVNNYVNAPTDGNVVAESGALGSERVLRGGGYFMSTDFELRSANRFGVRLAFDYGGDVGFRVVRIANQANE